MMSTHSLLRIFSASIIIIASAANPLLAETPEAETPPAETSPAKKAAETPLHQQIDALVAGTVEKGAAEKFEATASAVVGDAAFLRRVTLDLTGTIPTSQQVRDFTADCSKDKRSKLVDRLLASPEHVRRLQYFIDTMLMERRADKHIPSPQWQKYLRESMRENKPWDKLVREILTADGTDEKLRAAAKFLLDREMKTESVTRDLGRLFLGRDLECAQCHDHPNIDDYLQRHYHGLNAFLNRSYLFKDPKTKKTSIGEKAEGDVAFTSVFTKEEGKTSPRVLDLPEISDPPAAKELYKVKPEKNVRSVPTYSRRLQLAAAVTDQSNLAFRQNIVNRLWAMMMGRGLVEPLDLWHADNPPSHPEVVDLMAEAMQKNSYDIRFLLRELALSKTYQRSSQRGPQAKEDNKPDYSYGLLKPLTPEQLAWSIMQATGHVENTLADLKAKQLKADPKKGLKQFEDSLWREEALDKALQENVTLFATIFGKVGAQTLRFDASANQALFLRNGELVQGWLAPAGENLVARLQKLETPSQVAEEFYLTVFSRFPSKEETQQIALFLEESKADGDTGLQQLVWAALSSDEFRFNH